jgi:biotin-(acetyl-CoA carboxylase) ligase
LAFKETNDIAAAQRESKLTANQAEDLKFAGLITGKMRYNNQNKATFVIWGIN